ncbi:glycosyltransferase family 9 protein [Verrucomicrobiota bacterium]
MKFLDKYAGWVLCALLTGVDRLLSPFRRRSSSAELPEKAEILVMKFWGMGSTVLCTPFLKVIKDRYPGCRLTFFTLARNRSVVALFPVVDRILTLEIDNGAWSFISSLLRAMRELRRPRVDVAFDLEFFTRFSAIVAYLTGARQRVGFTAWEKWRGGLHTKGVPFNRYWHVILNFCNLAGALGLPVPDGPVPMRPRIGDRARVHAAAVLKDAGLSKDRFVCMNPNCGEIALTRRWPVENFVELSKKILEQWPDTRIAFIGSSQETGFVRPIVRGVGSDRAADLSGKLSVEELAYVLDQADLLITNDSGPLHLGFSVGTRTVSFFGPETPVLYGPVGDEHTIFFRNIDCSPCINVHEDKSFRCTRKSSICLETITVEDVWPEVKRMLS